VSVFLLGQLIGVAIGAMLNAGIQKLILAVAFRRNPVFFPLLKTVLFSSVALFLLGYMVGAAAGGMGAVIGLMFLGLFFVPLLISTFVKTVDGEEISYGAAFGAQIVQILAIVGLTWLIIQFA
jgi:hypothetical protein